MKIISKYYDFYDSCGPYNETEPVYVRIPQYFKSNNSYTWYNKSPQNSVENNFEEFLEVMRSKFSRNSRRHSWYRPNLLPVYYVGIYPYVYALPLHCRPLERFETLEGPQDIVGYTPRNSEEAKMFEAPKEIPEAFYALKAPVFIYSPDNIVFDKKHVKHHFSDVLEPASLIINPIIQHSCPGLLDKLALNPLRVYNDIENFLWSLKQEPINEPSNDTKILSAGFDLKTSFRNIK